MWEHPRANGAPETLGTEILYLGSFAWMVCQRCWAANADFPPLHPQVLSTPVLLQGPRPASAFPTGVTVFMDEGSRSPGPSCPRCATWPWLEVTFAGTEQEEPNAHSVLPANRLKGLLRGG